MRLAKPFVLTVIVCFWLAVFLTIYLAYRRAHKPQPPVPSEIGEGPGAYWHHGDVLLPNPALSPGAVRTTAVQEVCGVSTKELRETTESMKRRAYAKYGVTPHEGVCMDVTRRTRRGTEVTESCEVDHIISLELGGADTEENLFPQPYDPPNGIGAHSKDWVENYLHRQVCDHGYSLPQAQKEISTDWYKIYLEHHPQ